jgi:predicted phosphodiesterase
LIPDFKEDPIFQNLHSPGLLDISKGGRALIISDFHMGNGGRRDDLGRNGDLLLELLDKYYFQGNWILVLNGDIEELQRYSYSAIRSHWGAFYDLFDRFFQEGRLYKTLGNHDDELVFEKSYPYPLYDAVRIETGVLPVLVFHGHQSSRVYTKYNNLVRASMRYFFKPLGIRNISSARSPHRRFHVERRAYDFSRKYNVISIIGHTHRPLFESLGRFDYIKFEIERLCRDYPSVQEADQRRIAEEVKNLRIELSKLKRSERRRSLQESLYGDELPVPTVFNSGCAIGKKGLNAIELDGESISLVYWFTEGEGKRFVQRGAYAVEELGGTLRRRVVLNHDRLDYIKARIDLLG